MFHLDTIKADVVGNAKSVETHNRGEGNLGIYGMVPAGTTLAVVSGQEEPIVQGWIPRGKPYECQPIPTAVYRIDGSGTTTASFLLATMGPGEHSPISFAERVPSREGVAAGRAALMDGRMIHFASRRSGEGELSLDTIRSNGEAFAIVEGADGTIDDIFEVNGSGVWLDGTPLKKGDRLTGERSG